MDFARPVYHRKRDSIEAHLTIVFAALAVSHWIETTTGWSIKKFVRTALSCAAGVAAPATSLLPVSGGYGAPAPEPSGL